MKVRWRAQLWPLFKRIGRSDPPFPFNYTYYLIGPLVIVIRNRQLKCGAKL